MGAAKWREIVTIYRHELRCAFREKGVVIFSVLFPLFLFPFMMWVMISAMTLVEGQTENQQSRIAVNQWPTAHAGLAERFARDERLAIEVAANVSKQRIERGELDAIIEFEPASGAAQALSNNFQARILYNASKERSATANERIVDVFTDYRYRWSKREASARGISQDQWRDYDISPHNTASSKQMGAFLIGLIVPMLFTVMVSMGCLYPAVDAVAGEREHHTWETLLSSGASRRSVMMAKYLSVLTMGCLAGLLNVAAILLTAEPLFGTLMGPAKSVAFTVPLAALPVLAISALLLAGLIAAMLLVVTSFARTFAEGQAVAGPLYSVIPLPLLVLQFPGIVFTPQLALIPIVNIMMSVRTALSGQYPPLPLALTAAVSLLLIWLLLRLSAKIAAREDFISGPSQGGFKAFIRERLRAAKLLSRP